MREFSLVLASIILLFFGIYAIPKCINIIENQRKQIETLTQQIETYESIKCVNSQLVYIQKQIPFGHKVIVLCDQNGNIITCK